MLLDVNIRKIYDEHGIEGVEAAWQLGPYLGEDLQRLKEEIERQRVSKLLGGLRCKTIVSTGIDASMLMEDWSPIQEEMSFMDYIPRISTLSLSQHMESHLAEDTTLSLTCSAATKNGMGNGLVNGGIAKQISQALRGRIEFTVGNQKRLGAGLSFAITQKMNMDLLLNTHFYGGAIDPGYQLTFSRLLLDNIVSSVAVSGSSSGTGVSVSFSRVSETNPATFSIQYAGEDVAFDVKYSHQFDDQHTLKTRLSSTGPIQLSLGLIKRPTDGTNRKMSFTLEAGAAFGMGLKIGLALRELHLVLPLYISRELSSHSLLLGAGIPTIIGLLIHNFVLAPIQRWRRDSYWRNLQQSQKINIQMRREEALMTTTLLQPFYERRVQHEQSSNGLIIVKATYERASPMNSPLEPSKLDPDDFINVTVPLQMLVVDSHLWLAPNSKAQLLGFYDVAIGSGKILRVEYSFKGIAHQVIIRDDQELLLPLRRHIIE